MRPLLCTLFPIVSSAVEPPLHTSGNKVVDAEGEDVRLACVNWYGAHMERFVVNGLSERPVGDIAADIAELGFNCVRLVFSHDLFFKSPAVEQEAVSANPGLAGKPAMEVFDATVEALTSVGVMVILNNHISDAEWCCSLNDGNGLWYTDTYSASDFNEMWKALTIRYQANKLVVGADIRNELRDAHGVAPTWGDGNTTTDWKMAAEECGNVILQENSDLLIIVEGLDYAHDLKHVKRHPIQLSVPGRLVYSGHWYNSDKKFSDENYSLWEASVHYYEMFVADPDQIYTAPFWLGEFGTSEANACWNNTLELMSRRPELGWSYWALDGYKHSPADEEMFGLFEKDYKTIRHPWKLSGLQSIMPARQSSVMTV